MIQRFAWLGLSLVLGGCGLISLPGTNQRNTIPVAYMGTSPTLSGKISNWSGQTTTVQWNEYNSKTGRVTLAVGTVTPDGLFSITLPEDKLEQPYAYAFAGRGLPPLTGLTCSSNTLQFDQVPGITSGGLSVKIDGNSHQLELIEQNSERLISYQPRYVDREFTLSGTAVCGDVTFVGNAHGLPGWNWFTFAYEWKQGRSLETTSTAPFSGPLTWTLR